MRKLLLPTLLCTLAVLAGCVDWPKPVVTQPVPAGQGIVVDGEVFDAGTRVVLWTDPGGFDAYSSEKPTFGTRAGGPVLADLKRDVDQFVIHFDATGSSATTFKVLQKRGLSCHFLLDADGTVYQTLDLKERAWHATKANDRSVGIEIANTGTVPAAVGESGWAVDTINGSTLRQPPYTEAQYESLIRLTAALCRVFPNLPPTYPTDANGRVVNHTLTDAQFAGYHGLLGHFHVQTNKVDPGPAFDWKRVSGGAAALLR